MGRVVEDALQPVAVELPGDVGPLHAEDNPQGLLQHDADVADAALRLPQAKSYEVIGRLPQSQDHARHAMLVRPVGTQDRLRFHLPPAGVSLAPAPGLLHLLRVRADEAGHLAGVLRAV